MLEFSQNNGIPTRPYTKSGQFAYDCPEKRVCLETRGLIRSENGTALLVTAGAGMSGTDYSESSRDDAAGQSSSSIDVVKQKKPGEGLVGKTLFDRFEVLEVLGESAMALVLKAKEVNTERLVAIKTVTPHDQDVVKRFAQEVQLHGRLKHKNIVEAIDCLEASGGRTFFIMEFLYGASLQKVIQTQKRIVSEEDLGSILLQVCEALGHAHESGVLHRDLKPGNIFLLEVDGHLNVKVLDFGIAKPMGQQTGLTQAGYAVGSPLYMSPEQCRGQKVDARADVYSLGVLAYEMTTGNLPYGGHNIMTVMAAHCDPDKHPTALGKVLPDLRCVDQLDSIIQKAMETDPAKRFQSIAEFQKAVQGWNDAVQAQMLSSLVSGQQLNLPTETKHVVAEEARKASNPFMPAADPDKADEVLMNFAPDSVSKPVKEKDPPKRSSSNLNAVRRSSSINAVRSNSNMDAIRSSTDIDAVDDDLPEKRSSSAMQGKASKSNQKNTLRSTLSIPKPGDMSTKTKVMIVIVVSLLAFLLLAMFLLATQLLQ